MRADGEGEVAVRVASDVEPMGIGEHRRVAVGGGEAEQAVRTGKESVVTDDDVVGQPDAGDADRADEAQELLDRGLPASGVGARRSRSSGRSLSRAAPAASRVVVVACPASRKNTQFATRSSRDTPAVAAAANVDSRSCRAAPARSVIAASK